MAAEYGRVRRSMWMDPEIKRGLSKDEKLVAVYFFTSPHGNAAGIYACPLDYTASETGCSVEEIRVMVAGKLARWLTYDPETEEVWVHAGAKHNIAEALQRADRRVVHVQNILDSIHSGRLRAGFLERYGAAYHLTDHGGSLFDQPPSEGAPQGATQPPTVAPSKGLEMVTRSHSIAEHGKEEGTNLVEPDGSTAGNVLAAPAVANSAHQSNGAAPGRPSGPHTLVRQRVLGLTAGPMAAVLMELMLEGEAMATKEAARDAAAGVIFAYWAKCTGHPNAKLDMSRLARIRKRLEQAKDDANPLLFAAKGATKDDHLMARAPNATRKYDGIETIYRDWPQVERLAELGGYTPGAVHPVALKYLGGGHV